MAQSILDGSPLIFVPQPRRSGLSRAEREFIAVVVSRTNRCEYCYNRHAAALNFYWRDMGRIEKLRGPLEEAGLDDRLLTLGRYAEKLTAYPHPPYRKRMWNHSEQLDSVMLRYLI